MKRILLLLLFFGSFTYSFAQTTVTRKEPKPYYPPLPTSNYPIPPKAITTTPQTATANIGTVSIPSATPEAGQINALQDIPVNLYTGTPIIKIPLYTLQEGNLNIPLTLSYNAASGIRVGDVAGWTGLGWSLDGVPTISRIVRGLPDEGKIDLDGTPRKGYYAHGYYTNGDSDDNEPDYFFFSVNGNSYKFVLSPFGGYEQTRTFPESDIKISPITTANPNDNTGTVSVIIGWNITMPDGSWYHFDNDVEESAEVEVHYAQSNGIYPLGSQFIDFLNRNLVKTAWYATKIYEPYGNKIDLTYDRFAYTYYKLADNEASGLCPSSVTNKINKVYVRGAEIASIAGQNKKVVFNTGYKSCSYDNSGISNCTLVNVVRTDVDSWDNTPTNQSNSAKMLLKMVVSDNIANPTQNLVYTFTYDYLTASSYNSLPTGYSETNDVGTTHKRRLKLTALTMPDNNVYTFSYFGDGSTSFRTRLSYAIDHWGYLNGQDNNLTATGLIGAYDASTCPNGSHRETNSLYSLLGSLIKISSTAGSEISFEFEPHRALNYDLGGSDIGGFRIKRIHNKDLLRNTETIKEYSYITSNLLSSGFLFIKPTYHFSDDGRLGGNTYYSNSELLNFMLSESGKPIVGYNRGAETIYDNGNTTPTGKTVSYFGQNETELSLAHSGLCYDIITQSYQPCTVYTPGTFHPQHDYDSGSPLKTELYNQLSQLISSNEMSYTPNNGIKSDSVLCKKIIAFNNISQNDTYYLVENKYRIEQTISKAYSQDGTGTPQTRTVDLTYKDEMPTTYRSTYKGKHNQVVKTTTTDSYGYTIETFNKYAADFNFDKDSTVQCESDCIHQNPCPQACQYWLVTAHVPPANSEAKGIYDLLYPIPYAPVESFTKRNGKTITASYQVYRPKSTGGGNATLPDSSYLIRYSPISSFAEVYYNRSADEMAKDSHYGSARSVITNYNSVGYPTKSQQNYGSFKYISYDSSDLLPTVQIQNFGVADAMVTSYQYTNKFQGVSKIIAPNTLEIKYNYRSLDSRLQSIQNKDGNILKQLDYLTKPSN